MFEYPSQSRLSVLTALLAPVLASGLFFLSPVPARASAPAASGSVASASAASAAGLAAE